MIRNFETAILAQFDLRSDFELRLKREWLARRVVNVDDVGATDDFELGSAEDSDEHEASDSSSGSHGSKTSGWATPRSRSHNGLADGREHYENLGSGQGLGITGNPMDRSG